MDTVRISSFSPLSGSPWPAWPAAEIFRSLWTVPFATRRQLPRSPARSSFFSNGSDPRLVAGGHLLQYFPADSLCRRLSALWNPAARPLPAMLIKLISPSQPSASSRSSFLFLLACAVRDPLRMRHINRNLAALGSNLSTGHRKRPKGRPRCGMELFRASTSPTRP